MGEIKEIHKQLKKFNLNREVVKSLKTRENQIQLTQLLKDQHHEGLVGGDSRDYFDIEYGEYKKSLVSYRAPFPKIDLHGTGRFHKGFFVEVKSNFWGIWSRNGKTNELLENEGKDIFDLTSSNINHAQQIIQKDLSSKIGKIFK